MVAWYAVQVKKRHESRVERHLALRAIPAFLPLLEVIRRYRTRRVTLLQPLFLCYLFVHLSPVGISPHEWDDVRWAPGVRLIVGAGDTPLPVPDAVIESIQSRVRDIGFVRPGLKFVQNSRVKIRSGPLDGLEAIFDRQVSAAGRVCVLLELLGRQIGVELDVLDLESA